MPVEKAVYIPDAPTYADSDCMVWRELGPGYGAIAYTSPYCVPSDYQRENARRIAAAWNATRELTVEQLESLADRTINGDDLRSLGVTT